MELAQHLRKLVLWQAENYGDGLKLRNYQEPVSVAGMDNIPKVHQTQPDPPGNGSGYVAVDQLKLRAVYQSLIPFNRSLKLANLGLLRVNLLLGNNAFLE